MQVPFIDLKTQFNQIKPEINTALGEVLENALFLRSRVVSEFEAGFADAVGADYCIGVGNGTDAIQVILKCLGIGPGDEVITAANTCFPTAEAILMTGARVVFTDVDPETYTMDPNDLERKINAATRAIIPVHLYGQVAQMKQILEIADKYQIPVVEDASHAHFAEFDGKKAGTFGLAAAFSFYPSKPLGAYGDAGCVLTSDQDLAEKVRKYANHGSAERDVHELSGINSRLDGMQAAVLNVKLRYAEEWLKKRNQHAENYRRQLRDITEISLPVTRSGGLHAFHLFVIRCEDQKQRDGLMGHLESKNIGTLIHYPYSLPEMQMFRVSEPARYPISNAYSRQILSLPLFPELRVEQIDYVCEQVRAYFN